MEVLEFITMAYTVGYGLYIEWRYNVPQKRIMITCGGCKKRYSFYVESTQYAQWKAGEPIQYAMPSLTDSQRELLISGSCGDCFDTEMREWLNALHYGS